MRHEGVSHTHAFAEAQFDSMAEHSTLMCSRCAADVRVDADAVDA